MPLSPICQIRVNAGPWVPTTDGVDAVGGDTISIRLADASAVTAWYLQPIGTDELSATPVLTGVNPVTFLVASPATIPTFVIPAGTGQAYLFQSTVQGVGGPLATRFGIYVLTPLGDRVGAVGEAREGDQNFGWITKVNPLIRNPGAGGFTAGGDLSGSSTNQTVEAIQGVVISGVAAAGKVLTAASAVAGSWQDPAPGFTAGGDLSGTSTDQTVAKINGATAPATPALGDVGKVIGVTGAGVYGLVASGGGGGSYVKSAMAEITVDTDLIVAVYTPFLTLGPIVFGASGASFALIRFTGSVYSPGGGGVRYRLVVDGAPVRGMLVNFDTVASISAIQYRMALAAGPHTFVIEVKDPVSCYPVTQPEDHHAVLIVEEVLS